MKHIFMKPRWGKIPAAAAHAGVSPRTFREWLKMGLSHSRLPTGTILVRYEDIDAYLKRFNVTQKDETMVDEIVSQLTKEMKL